MELIKPQKGTNYNIENDIQNLTDIEQEFEQIDNKITNDITSSINELKDKVDNDITAAITELDNKVDTEIVTAIDNLETKVNTEISESITALDNKVTTSLQEQTESLKKEISDQIAKVVANSPEDFDTLKEISDWISGHSNDATAMNSAISGNTSAINQEILDRQAADTALQTNIDNIEQQLSNVFSAENFVEDFNTTIEPGVYFWTDSTLNRPMNYGVLLVNRFKTTSDWINQIAYSTNGKIYFRQKINDGAWTAWETVAYEDITKTYTIPDVTTATTRYIKLGTFPWNFSETVKVLLQGNNFEDTIEFNGLGGNSVYANVCGWYTTNRGSTQAILVVPGESTFTNFEVWLKIEQYTTCTVKLTGNAKAAQYFNSNPQMNNTTTSPTNGKTVATFNMKKGFFGYNENSLNCYETTMTDLGFTNNQAVSVSEFAQALINYTGTTRGQVRFLWADVNRAYIRATSPFNTQLEISGGTIIFTNSSTSATANWTVFEAEYINRLGEVYTLGIQKDTTNTFEYVRKAVDTSTARTNADAGYLCKLYDIGGHTNQAYNVILLGKIPDPASTAAPATPSTSWDIDVDFYFVRSQGHKASWCNVKAGYGYSNEWRKYGSIETFGVDVSSSYSNPFSLVTLKYNNEWYIGVKHLVNIDGNYSARVHNVNIAGGRNPSNVGNTPLANMLKAIGYKKTDNTILNSEINSSIADLPNTYAPTIERNGGLVIKTNTDVALNSFGKEPLSIGTTTGDNLGIDSNEIQARLNGNAAPLYLNGSGGKVFINDTKASNGGLQVGGNTTLQSSQGVTLQSYGLEPLSIGDASGRNIGIDGDDIQARSNGAVATLDLNYLGGMVRVNAQGLANSGLMVGGKLNIPTKAPSSPQKGDIWLVL